MVSYGCIVRGRGVIGRRRRKRGRSGRSGRGMITFPGVLSEIGIFGEIYNCSRRI